jgi:hypothetical protein
MTIKCEVINSKSEFRFRLVDGDSHTMWCSYGMICYLNGMVAATQYYLPESHECLPITTDEFCRLAACGLWED